MSAENRSRGSDSIRQQTRPQELGEVTIREGLDSLSAIRVATLFRRAPLFRKTGSSSRLWEAFEASSLTLSAWHDGQLVGLVRMMTDGVLFSYICDIAVEPDVQRLGIGRRLMDEAFERVKGTRVFVLDEQIKSGYFTRAGFERVGNMWSKMS
ncbi:MAG: GNAT family N-acetyltransferase [Bacteroidota bacterium]